MTRHAMSAIVFASFFVAPSLLAWGQGGHTLIAEAATFGTPAELPEFFHRAYPTMIARAPEPDWWLNAGDSLEGAERPDHFIDLEFVAGMDLPVSRYAFDQMALDGDLLRKHGLKIAEVGYLPWRIAETADLLEYQWRLWRRNDLATANRRHVESVIVELSSVLSHFVADSSNPHHTTMHYNGWLGPNNAGYANDCQIHARFETQFVSRTMNLDDLMTRREAPQLVTDYFHAAVEWVRTSNGEVEKLYRIDRDGGFSGRGTVEGREFTAARMATGAAHLRDLWWSAYVNSAKKR